MDKILRNEVEEIESMKSHKRPDYGLDAPGLVRWFLLGGTLLLGLSMFAESLPYGATLSEFLRPLVWPGLSFTGSGILMIWSSYYGKFRARDRLLQSLKLLGHETLVDLGCGRGLLLNGAAKLLASGKAIGVDLWSQQDLSANSRPATLQNAELEGVKDRVEVLDCDMRKLPFESQTIDCVVASMSIHNIPSQEGRKQAVLEAYRVLKPAGKMALLDFKYSNEYLSALMAAGAVDVCRSPISFWNFPPSRTVFATKRAK